MECSVRGFLWAYLAIVWSTFGLVRHKNILQIWTFHFTKRTKQKQFTSTFSNKDVSCVEKCFALQFDYVCRLNIWIDTKNNECFNLRSILLEIDKRLYFSKRWLRFGIFQNLMLPINSFMHVGPTPLNRKRVEHLVNAFCLLTPYVYVAYNTIGYVWVMSSKTQKTT